ncbi:hypothetical protein LTR78_007996 [Recurvomyces mirabilis]|uniref:Zn(2)-C6 fungal-type domain-containing protein n=1 Tax=Recurvomyces mirabilis TaxID=574656 RepID=A0AAE0TRL4_9PEZI|nr:hypothetical protein LTR78_007996 [Recurvomyces mirabilis]KAK5150724.1 hypothetical protein LTS14_009786 [Recurvomyces mirabilis]
MDGHYPPPVPPLGAFYSTGPPPMYPPEPYPPGLHQLQTMSLESLGSYPDYDDPNLAMLPPGHVQGQQRQRRRQPQSSEHVKHRRTRSGCYTCRQRRVKCDETRPICDRCRKGKRDCAYPGSSSPTTSGSKSSHSSKKAKDDGASSGSDEDYEEESKSPLHTILDDEDALDDSESPSGVSDARKQSSASTASSSQQLSPSIERVPGSSTRPKASRTTTKHTVKPSITQNSRWASLPKEIKAYLRYHHESLSHHHYGFKYDAGDFLKSTFLEIAMNDESWALLHGIVAFAAYHHAVHNKEPAISRFLMYYNQSINLLQQSLKKKRHNIATLLTILQLATIEEFLGDWNNLLGHQRAAHQLLMDLFTPQTIMQDETRRRIIAWYIRFDLFAGLLAGNETNLDRAWFAVCADFYDLQARERPSDLGAKFEGFFSTARLLATDVTLLFAARHRDSISDEDFDKRVSDLTRQFDEFRTTLKNAFEGPSSYVQEFPLAPPPSADDLTNFRDPYFLYGGDLFTMNYVLIDFWAIDLHFKMSLASIRRQSPPPDLREIALKKCKMFEAIQYYDKGPAGGIIGCQASLGIASLCLPHDKKHIDWCRQKFALIEQNGYIYPSALRQRMTGIWGVDVNHWWLANEEGFPQVVRAIRDFVEYRASMPQDAAAADVRDMSGIFRTLNMSDDGGLPEDLKGFTTDFDTLGSAMQWDESSPEQQWP